MSVRGNFRTPNIEPPLLSEDTNPHRSHGADLLVFFGPVLALETMRGDSSLSLQETAHGPESKITRFYLTQIRGRPPSPN